MWVLSFRKIAYGIDLLSLYKMQLSFANGYKETYSILIYFLSKVLAIYLKKRILKQIHGFRKGKTVY